MKEHEDLLAAILKAAATLEAAAVPVKGRMVYEPETGDILVEGQRRDSLKGEIA